MDIQTARAEIREFLEGFQQEILALRPSHHGESDEEIAAAMWRDAHRLVLEKQIEELKTVYIHALYDIKQERKREQT